MLGAGAGHIGQPLGLLQLGVVILSGGGAAAAPVGVEVQIQAGLVVPWRQPAPPQPLAARLGRGRGLPQVRADHHGIVQAFAAVHRHHGDRRLGGIAAAEVLIGGIALFLQPQVAQPIGCGHGAEPLAVHLLLHQLGRLLQIRQGPPPQGEPCQPFGAEQLGEHAGEPQPRQLLRPAAELAPQLIPAFRRAALQLRRRPTEQR